MSSLIQKLRDFDVPDLSISYLINQATTFEEAFQLYIQKQETMIKLISEFGLDERNAHHYAYNSRDYEEAASLMFSTIRQVRSTVEQGELSDRSIRSKALVPKIDDTSTISIYLAAPGVVIEGREVISTDRDAANSFILDSWGKKPLDPTKIQTYPLYIVNDPSLVEGNCVICQETYKINDVVLLILPCNHFFHKDCVLHHFQYKSVCPIDNVLL
jgi:hypothetical protein